MLRCERNRAEFQVRSAILFRRSYNRRACFWRMLRDKSLSHDKRVHRRVIDAINWRLRSTP